MSWTAAVATTAAGACVLPATADAPATAAAAPTHPRAATQAAAVINCVMCILSYLLKALEGLNVLKLRCILNLGMRIV